MRNSTNSSPSSTLLNFFLLTWFLGFSLIYIFNSQFIDFTLISATEFSSRMRFSEFSQVAFSSLSLVFLVPLIFTSQEKLESLYYAGILTLGLILQVLWSASLSLFSSSSSSLSLAFSFSHFVSEIAFSLLQIILVTQGLRMILQKRFPRKDHQLTLQILSFIGISLLIEMVKIIILNIPITNTADFYLRFLPSGLLIFLIILEYKTNLVQTVLAFIAFYTLSQFFIYNFDFIAGRPLPAIVSHVFYYVLSYLLFLGVLNFSKFHNKLSSQNNI